LSQWRHDFSPSSQTQDNGVHFRLAQREPGDGRRFALGTAFFISKELDMNADTTTTSPAAAESEVQAASRREFIKKGTAIGGAALFSTLGHHGVWAAGSDAPEKTEVKIGFIPLTDCASVVMAAELGIDKKYGVKIIPTKEASWAGVRDKLVNGELDMAHVLYGLIYGLQLGTAGPKKAWRS
jgi:ABC-type nitrate/sulfonate/bicarbonate transport systems, periplasmic components